MIFISSGKGGWIFGSLFISLALAVGLDHYLLPPAHRIWPISLAIALAALVCFALGAHARRSPERLVLETQTGRERMQRSVHSAYWIPAEYWGLLYLALSGWLLTLHPSP